MAEDDSECAAHLPGWKRDSTIPLASNMVILRRILCVGNDEEAKLQFHSDDGPQQENAP